jgi:mannose-6-phosphate isomerase-like protein (cupin superfamily)
MNPESSNTFYRADEIAPSDRTERLDLRGGEVLDGGVHALEPGRRYEPAAEEHEERILVVLRGRGAFVVGEHRRILEAGDIAVVPAGEAHRAFANQGERLLLLVVAARIATSPAVAATPESEVREEPASAPVESDAPVEEPPVLPETRPVVSLSGLVPVLGGPSPAETPPVLPETRPTVSLAGLTVPVLEEPAETPPELPVTRRTALPVPPSRAPEPAEQRAAADITRVLDMLRAPVESTSVEPAPVLPEVRRCAPRTSRVIVPASEPIEPGEAAAIPARRENESTRGADWLPEIFRKPAASAEPVGAA